MSVLTSRSLPLPLTILAAVTAAAAVGELVAGPGAAYSAVFPPPWLALLGVAASAVSVIAHRHGQARPAEVAGWTAAVVLLGASGGVVLDLFRGFYAVTGIPAGEFAVVDVPGLVTRGAALLTAFTAMLMARRTRQAAAPGSAGNRPVGRGLLIVGLVATVPYPVLKLAFWLGGDDAGFPAAEIACFSLAALWLILLSVGRVRVLPRWIVSAGGWFAALVLLSMGALMVFGLLSQAAGLAAAAVQFGSGAASVMVFAVYGCWLLLGVVMAAATVRYGERRDAEGSHAAGPIR